METKTFELRDEFKRKLVAQKVISLLSSDIDISPMVIDGNWGTGKTEFCHKLINLMKQEQPEYQLVYLDAFRSDHSGEPLLALLAQIIKDCTPEDQANGQPSAERKALTKKFAKAAGFVAKTVAKAAAGHVLKQSVESLSEGFQHVMEGDTEAVAETVSDTMVKLSDKAIDSTIEVLLKEQVDAEKNLEALRKCLSEFASDNPIVLFIDELDRCRPDYAVEMLETVKHVFEVENVKVVLVTNTQQLRAAINHRYGLAVDSQRYLDKFLKYSFSLPEKTLKGYEDNQVSASVTHFSTLVQNSSILRETKLVNQQEGVYSLAKSLIDRKGLSLREVETFVRYLEIYHKLSDGLASNVIFGYQLLRIAGVFMVCFAPDIVTSISRNRTDAIKIANLFGIHELPDYQSEQYKYSYSFADIVAVMLAQESTLNKMQYHSADEAEQAYWKECKEMCFKNGFGRTPDNLFSPIIDVINYLQFSKVGQ